MTSDGAVKRGAELREFTPVDGRVQTTPAVGERDSQGFSLLGTEAKAELIKRTLLILHEGVLNLGSVRRNVSL